VQSIADQEGDQGSTVIPLLCGVGAERCGLFRDALAQCGHIHLDRFKLALERVFIARRDIAVVRHWIFSAKVRCLEAVGSRKELAASLTALLNLSTTRGKRGQMAW
jgi:hypothetical protein